MCALAVCAFALAAAGAPAARAAGSHAVAGRAGSVLVAFAPAPAGGAFEAELARAGGLSLAIMSAAQGSYTTAQLVLDITQGARIASSAYRTPSPPALRLVRTGTSAVVRGWAAARRRAEAAPQLLEPGLLAAQVPGGAAYAGLGAGGADAALAADRSGHIAAVSLGSAPTLLARVRTLLARRRLVVCDLPGGPEGAADLSALSRERVAGELLITVQRTPDGPAGALLWAGAAGLAGGAGRELSSSTTNQRGLTSAIDLAPTILRHLGVTRVPAAMRGAALRTDGPLRSSSLRSLMARLRVIGGRRLRALAFLLCGWALLLSLSALRRGPAGRRRRAWALRAGAVAVLWAPLVALLAAALETSAALEYTTIALTCLGLGAITDALLAWPRAPIAPALVTLAALVVDALARTQLLMRSLLGPNPILGARFYGFGNELKSALAVLVLAAVAAAVYPARVGPGAPLQRRRRAAVATAASGALLAAIEGWARIGAAVGGVILVCLGTAVATVLLLPGRVTRKRAMIVLLSPLAGLLALAVLDLAAAHGTGHYAGSILHARSAGDLRDVLERRYSAAWHELRNHAMPAATAIALLCAVLGLRWRERLLAPVGADRAWQAALAGGLAAGVVGALVEDSGPVLLVVAVFALGCVLSYLWGRPPPIGDSGTLHAGRSRALGSAPADARSPA